jgi:hypothetical protein
MSELVISDCFVWNRDRRTLTEQHLNSGNNLHRIMKRKDVKLCTPPQLLSPAFEQDKEGTISNFRSKRLSPRELGESWVRASDKSPCRESCNHLKRVKRKWNNMIRFAVQSIVVVMTCIFGVLFRSQFWRQTWSWHNHRIPCSHDNFWRYWECSTKWRMEETEVQSVLLVVI